MQNRFFNILIFCFFLAVQAQAQEVSSQKIEALNNYIEFSNESTHGMLIISRMLENFNKKVNNYLETQDKDISNYSNGDLPKDIFLDPEKWFYEVSPTIWYDRAIKGSKILNPDDAYQMNFIIKKMKKITTDANLFRFKLEEYVNFLNYKDPVYLNKLYVVLEEAVVFFDHFYKEQLALEALVNKQKTGLNQSSDPIIVSYEKFYTDLRNILTDLRNKENADILGHVQAYKSDLAAFTSTVSDSYFGNSRLDRKVKSIKTKSQAVLAAMEDYLNKGTVPEEYKDYGKYYYFHNANLLNKTNKYGNGLVSEMNKIILKKGMAQTLFFEIPHFYKVIVKKITWKKRDYSKKKKRKNRR